MPIEFDVENFEELKGLYKRELKAKSLWAQAMRYRAEMRNMNSYSERDCWLLMMHEYSEVLGLIDPIPDVRRLPVADRRSDGPMFETVTNGKAMTSIPTPEEHAAQQTHSQIEPLPLSDMQWVYAHIGESRPPCEEFPPPSKGAVGVFHFAKTHPDKFYAMFLKMVEKKMAEEEVEIASEREALSSVEVIKGYLADLGEEDDKVSGDGS